MQFYFTMSGLSLEYTFYLEKYMMKLFVAFSLSNFYSTFLHAGIPTKNHFFLYDDWDAILCNLFF